MDGIVSRYLQSMGMEGSRSAKGHLPQNHELVDLRPAEVSLARPWRIGFQSYILAHQLA